MDQMEEYLQGLIPERDGLFKEMEEFAKEKVVPIMEPDGMETLLQILRLHNPKSILEVGAAIGYSSLRMSAAFPQAKIVTIERNAERIAYAKTFIAKANKQEVITLIEGDALEAAERVSQSGPYDAIFIDAAKGQYLRFFKLYEPFLKQGGIIINDNVLFKGLVAEKTEDIQPRRRRALVKKIQEFNAWLANHPDYHTVILPIGDGVAISKHRGEKE